MADHHLSLNKEKYSEMVVRKALYWFSSQFEWALDDNDSDWIVKVYDANCKCEPLFYRLLNDQVLRHKIDTETQGLRKKIIKKVLEDIEKTV